MERGEQRSKVHGLQGVYTLFQTMQMIIDHEFQNLVRQLQLYGFLVARLQTENLRILINLYLCSFK